MSKPKHTPSVMIGCYRIYPDGRIISHHHWRGNAYYTVTPTKDRYGYLEVRLSIDGKRKKWKLHKLIAECFLPERPSHQHEIRHLDGDKTA